ncbi:MAG: glutathione peroxidase [Paraglaciecola psychrophila]
MSAAIYDFEAQTIAGETVSLGAYEGQAILIVNTASKCGLTPQYQGLEQLYQDYSERGLVVLGFPCNQFGSQEPGSESDIESFCQLNYGVSFPMFAKIEVNGFSADPLYKYLKKARPGFLGSENIKWNFTKFLINRQGDVVERFAPTDRPQDMAGKIEALL